MGKIILLPHGTAGDVLPYIWLGRVLREQGHQVTMIWIESFRAAAERAGLNYMPMPNEGFEAMLRNPALWQPHLGLLAAFAYAGECMSLCLEAFDAIVAREGLPDLMIAPSINFAARLLREKHGIPFVTVVLQPQALLSVHDMPANVPYARLLKMLPAWVRTALFSMSPPCVRPAMPHVEKHCQERGVKPPKKLLIDWGASPDGMLVLFPAWYARPQPDWPAKYYQWDFPLEDLSNEKPLPQDLAAFLQAGAPPVVFTLGTGNLHVRNFFKTSAELCGRLGCRAVFVTRDPDQAPAQASPDIFVTSYAPFSTLLAHAAAFVHHGGIGTVAQCLKAGVPQLIVFMNFDQPDNAARVQRFNAGEKLAIQDYTVENAEPLLRRCLEDESIRQGAADCAAQMAPERPTVDNLVEWLKTRMQSPVQNLSA